MLKIENLDFSYGRIKALRGINLEIKEGEIVSLVGANGAGKTTLLRVISALQKEQKGKIIFKDKDISDTSSKERVKLGIAQVPEGRGLFDILSVEDNLLMGAYIRDDDEIKDDIEWIYELFPVLREKKEHYAGTLSGGQQQMLSLGRALMSRPKLLLLDEPSMGLAPIIVDDIFEVLQNLQKNGTTIFLVEQNAHLALSFSDRAYVLENGQIVMSGKSSELVNDKKVKEAYLGV
jgi:branched-chain amino acid transport system ATP-binding protein